MLQLTSPTIEFKSIEGMLRHGDGGLHNGLCVQPSPVSIGYRRKKADEHLVSVDVVN